MKLEITAEIAVNNAEEFFCLSLLSSSVRLRNETRTLDNLR